LNQILKRQTSPFHYGSKFPAVTITVFTTILEQNMINISWRDIHRRPSWTFQLNLLLLSQLSMCRNFGYFEVGFQSLIYKSIQIMFAMSQLSIKSINRPVKVSTGWPPVYIPSADIYHVLQLINPIVFFTIRVITKLPNSEHSNKGKVKTHKYIKRQNQSTTRKLWKP
jgi:hypothetical protein